MLFLKLGVADWTPVGAENSYAVVPGKGGLAALVVCDAEGNAKAMTPMMEESKATEAARRLEQKNLSKFEGEVRLPV